MIGLEKLGVTLDRAQSFGDPLPIKRKIAKSTAIHLISYERQPTDDGFTRPLQVLPIGVEA